jgi:hypothetical protein
MSSTDLVIHAFVDELAALEKRAGLGGYIGAGLLGMAALPVAKMKAVQSMREGAPDFGDYSRAQFERRFGQHLPGASIGEIAGMTGHGLYQSGKSMYQSGKSMAAPAVNTAKEMWKKPGYVRDNFGR